MTLFVKILQVGLALWLITGSIYMIGHYPALARPEVLEALPSVFWKILGAIQIVLSLGLLISIKDSMSKYATPSAIGLALIVLLGIFLYSSFTSSGILWAVIPAAVLAFVAYKRKS